MVGSAQAIVAHLPSVGLRLGRSQDLAEALVREGYDEVDLVQEMTEESLKKCGFRDGDLAKVGRSKPDV